MNHFSFRLDSEKRLAQLVPPLLSIGYSTQDPPAFRALKRDTVNIGVILSANFRLASYEMDGRRYSALLRADPRSGVHHTGTAFPSVQSGAV